jgi:3-mercaptopyruvate sulfurtransferase SseA
VALLLKRRGIIRIRPLGGGLEGWQQRGLPLEPFALEPATEKIL